MKKIIIGVLTLSLCFVVLGVTQVRGEETDIKKEIAAIEAMLESIQAEIKGKTEGVETVKTIEGVPSGFTFTRNMGIGARGADVKHLQIVLNSDADTRLTQTGPGSPGNETEYFGPITQGAVRKFQSKYSSEILAPIGLTSPTGFVGVQTRAKLNTILSKGAPTKEDPGSSLAEVVKALEEINKAIKDLRERVDAIDKPATGEEGVLSVELRSDIIDEEVPANGKAQVALFRIKAEDSDIDIRRVDLYFNHSGTHSVTATEFRRYVANVALYTEDKKLQDITLSTSNPGRDDKYIRFSNIDLKVSEGEYKDLIVEITGTGRDETKVLEIGFTDSMAIRGIDEAGISQYAGGSAIRRTFTFTGEEIGALEVRRDADNLREGVAMVSEKNRTQVELLRFTVTAKHSDVEINDLTFFIEEENTSLALSQILQNAMLYKGSERVKTASVNSSDGETVFAGMSIEIPKGKTETFVLKADALRTKISDQGASLRAVLNKGDNEKTGYDINDNDVGIDRDVNGYKQHLYVIAPEIVLTNTDIERVEITKGSDDRAAGEIEFKIKAVGGDIYFEKKEDVKNANEGAVDIEGFDLSFASFTSKARSKTNPLGLTGDYYYVLAGNERDVEIGLESINASERNRFEVSALRWIVKDENGDAMEFEWKGFFVEDLKTGRVSLYW